MKILVTGASGFIGGRFARFALEQGLDVRVNGRRAEGDHLISRQRVDVALQQQLEDCGLEVTPFNTLESLTNGVTGAHTLVYRHGVHVAALDP